MPGTGGRTTCSPSSPGTATPQPASRCARGCTTTPTSRDRPSAWPPPSTTRSWSSMTALRPPCRRSRRTSAPSCGGRRSRSTTTANGWA